MHHIVTRQELRKHPKINPDDPRNLIPLCLHCHSQHHAALPRITRDRLPLVALEFAEEHGLDWYIDRTYPVIAEGNQS